MSASAQIAMASPHELAFEKQPITEVHIGFAVHLLGIEPREVVRLCKTGALHARCNRHGTWRIDEAFLLRWHEANPNYGAAVGESSDNEERGVVPTVQLAPVPSGACEAHWQRRKRVVPAFRLDLCRRCFLGHPLPPKAEEEGILDPAQSRVPVASVQAEPVVSEKREPVIQEAIEKEHGKVAIGAQETMSVSDAALFAGFSHDTMLRLVEQGAIEARRVRSRGWWRVDRTSLTRFLNRCADGENSANATL